ncbi:hypothetical protein J2R76_003599 [Bradyrhizobium sp. USDA 4532]|uniref:hypothetical protein n=1 Tax=unclassified Bradyrhizobium TaxID=2631580 RepID=UPI00209CBD76|nr:MULTISPECIES: hypothetical protein [unclassified Bradyrhizobium]MCP1835262.1 hypothetical protein [Bradyrhizobium sp. USDA 4545]MCP1920008.1 hypothetical protein [Bradyrhizobium sp. USDA 4532]
MIAPVTTINSCVVLPKVVIIACATDAKPCDGGLASALRGRARIEAEALMAHVRSRLARFKVPSEIIFTHGEGPAFCAEGSQQAIKRQGRRQLSSGDADTPCFPATLPMMP